MIGLFGDTETETSNLSNTTKAESASEASEKANAPTQPEPREESYSIVYESAKTVKVDYTGDVWVFAVCQVKNTGNVNLYSSTCYYDISNSNGKILKSDNMSVYPIIIQPGESFYYFSEGVIDEITEEIEVDVEFRPDIKPAKRENIRYEVSDAKVTYDKDVGSATLIGRVKNTGNETPSILNVSIIYFDKDGHPISYGNEWVSEDVAPGATVGFECYGASRIDWLYSIDAIESYEIYAYPEQMQFN